MKLKDAELSAPIRDFVKVFEASISSVLSQTMGAKWSAVAGDEQSQREASDALNFSFLVTKGLGGRFRISLKPPDAMHLVAGFIGEDPSTIGPWQEGHRDALSELLRQIAGEIASQLRKEYGEVGMELENREPPEEVLKICVEAKAADGTEIPIWCCISSDLQDSIKAHSSSAVPSASVKSSRQENLELLMGVELRATLRFGQRQMFLRELLNLNAGSIVELDRQVQEPVDLLVDGRVIAKGEVVILDGNYGMRVTSVASPQSIAGCLR